MLSWLKRFCTWRQRESSKLPSMTDIFSHQRAQSFSKSATRERHIYVNQTLPGELLDVNGKPIINFPSNRVVTSKYSVLSFLPKNLFEQFRRFANVFFLLLIILQAFKEFETVDPFVVALPTVVIVLVTALKDGVEDLKRHQTDAQVNGRPVHILPDWVNHNHAVGGNSYSKNGFLQKWNRWFQFKVHTKSMPKKNTALARSRAPSTTQTASDWKEIVWEGLRVGDIVRLQNNEFIPADVVILSTSEPDCVCYVETKNLDGETNLKVRKGINETAHAESVDDCRALKLVVNAEPPNNNMFTFNGSLNIDSSDSTDFKNHKVPINMNGVLLRGCILRNTTWVIGVIVYTGGETKLRLNAGETPSKRSIIEKKMNPQIMVNLVLLALICIVCAVGNSFWGRLYSNGNSPFLPNSKEGGIDPNLSAFLAFWYAESLALCVTFSCPVHLQSISIFSS
jgi:phospholipid-translocating ATPase